MVTNGLTMGKLVIVVALYLISFVPAFGQEVVSVSTIAKGSAFTLPDVAKLSEKKERVVVHRDRSVDFDLVDPNMPIMVPPKDLFSKFPVKKLPEKFPSDMPVLGPEKKSLGLREEAFGEGSNGPQ